MNNNTNKLLIPALLLASFVLSWMIFSQAIPFLLNGKHFLVFYLLHCLSIIFILKIIAQKQSKDLFETGSSTDIIAAHPFKRTANYILVFSAIIGLARLSQGLYNHKPVGFLVILFIIALIIYYFIITNKSKAID